jgi:ketosteroid isomerase-like protein
MSGSAVEVVRSFAAAIGRRDAAALAEMMTENHRFVDSLGNVVEGREKMRAGWAGYFRMVPDYSITVDEVYGEGSVVVLVRSAQGTYSADGQLHAENHWRTPAVFRAVVEDGRVAEWRVFADNEPIRRLMAKR